MKKNRDDRRLGALLRLRDQMSREARSARMWADLRPLDKSRVARQLREIETLQRRLGMEVR